jgi:fatty-acyl-CoA synthase/long-chain acyl-CoA synthetase
VTYEELAQRALLVARGLLGLGIGPGMHVGLLMPNSLEWIEGYLGLALLGAVSVPINTRYQTDEISYLIEHADMKAVLTTTDFVELLRRSSSSLPHIVVLSERSGLEAAAASVPSADVLHLAQAVRLQDTASLLYTSGTTARPKGCVLSYEALVRTGVARLEERRRDQDQFVVWTPCPLFHGGALLPLIGSIATGSTYVTTGRFDAGETLALLEDERVTNALPLFPAFTDALLDHPAFATTDLSSLRDILTTGTPRGVLRAQVAFAPAKLLSAYGMTELCAVASTSRIDEPDEDRLVWSGRPFEGIDIKIVDPDTGLDVPHGQIGELVARGYCVFDRYHKDAAATAAVFDQDGWFHTGDMGVAHPDGRVAFRGRYKDMLKVGGENVSALEVETFLGRHEAVRRVEVVGAPDPRLDQVVAAFIELEPGASATESELIAFCTGRIARFKTPRYVWFMQADEWPMSATKVDKVALRQRVLRQLETPGGSR